MASKCKKKLVQHDFRVGKQKAKEKEGWSKVKGYDNPDDLVRMEKHV